MYCTHVACISDLTYSKHKHRTGWLGRPMNMASTSKTPQQCKTWSIALLGGGQTLIKINMLSMVLLDSTVWNESCWWNIDGVSRGISQLGKIHMWHPFICLGLLYKRNAFSRDVSPGGPCSKAKASHSKALYALGLRKGSLSQFFWPPLFCIITDMRWMLRKFPWMNVLSQMGLSQMYFHIWFHLERCKTMTTALNSAQMACGCYPYLTWSGPPELVGTWKLHHMWRFKQQATILYTSILNLPQNSIQHIHQDHPSPKEALFAIFSPCTASTSRIIQLSIEKHF